MIIKLFHPAFNNWLIVAEELDDPKVWDRFLPCHTIQSERWKFDTTVKELAETKVKLAPCRSYLKRGMSAFEYDWNSDEEDVLDHAMRVADVFGLELNFSPPGSPNSTAA